MVTDRPWVVIGVEGNKRSILFQAAICQLGIPRALEISWQSIVKEGSAFRAIQGLPEHSILRIDSAGDSAEFERDFILRGELPTMREGRRAIGKESLDRIPRVLGSIICPRQQHLGFLAVLDEIDTALRHRPDIQVLQPPKAIAELFDKRLTSQKWSELGIAVPEPIAGGFVVDPDDLRSRMERVGWERVFVKLSSGSSASCIAIFEHGPKVCSLTTTVEDAGLARYNTRRLHRLTDTKRIDRVLRFILSEGAQVERAIPKARVSGTNFDLRVLAMGGVVGFVVVRTSEHEITNLHIGGKRGDLKAVRELISQESWSSAMETCIAVQKASGAFHVGIDLLFDENFSSHMVIEGNAFGDLLPKLSRDGLDVYGWQIKQYLQSLNPIC